MPGDLHTGDKKTNSDESGFLGFIREEGLDAVTNSWMVKYYLYNIDLDSLPGNSSLHKINW